MSDSSQLVIDLGALETLVSQLSEAALDMHQLNDDAKSTAGSVGHAGLAAKVTDFATKWEHHRDDIVDNINALVKQIQAVIDGITKTDGDLTSQIATAPSTSASIA